MLGWDFEKPLLYLKLAPSNYTARKVSGKTKTP